MWRLSVSSDRISWKPSRKEKKQQYAVLVKKKQEMKTPLVYQTGSATQRPITRVLSDTELVCSEPVIITLETHSTIAMSIHLAQTDSKPTSSPTLVRRMRILLMKWHWRRAAQAITPSSLCPCTRKKKRGFCLGWIMGEAILLGQTWIASSSRGRAHILRILNRTGDLYMHSSDLLES